MANFNIPQELIDRLATEEVQALLEGLEDEPDLPVADMGQLLLVHVGGVLAGEDITPGGGHIQAADDVHHGGLARSGRAENGDKFAPAHRKIDVLKDHLLLFPHLVALDDVPHRQNRFPVHPLSSLSPRRPIMGKEKPALGSSTVSPAFTPSLISTVMPSLMPTVTALVSVLPSAFLT